MTSAAKAEPAKAPRTESAASVFFHLKGFYSKRTALLPKGSKALRNPCTKLRQILSDIAKTKSFSMFHATRMGLGAAIIML
ncbi:hypothetical protein [Sutterella wadsworthensis]|uniref:hypothetical protein n=1 Tax=Sutterella wadsworthensis TaxID=40545 RepID=UPI000ED0E550|nr:hypothetical protein [Sutterella wadsworthensis]HCE88731.1 hypothetical protein [Sutterella wadsworthensis]